MDEKGIGHFYGHPVLSQELTAQAVKRLRLSAQTEERVLYLVRHHDTPLGRIPKHVRRKLAVHGEQNFRALLAMKKADCIGQGTTPRNLTELLQQEQLLEQVLAEQSCLTRRDLAVNGNDLIAWGIKGRAIRRYLAEMLAQVLDHPEYNTKEKLREIFEQLRAQDGCIELTVSGMSAGSCVRDIKKLLTGIPQVDTVDITLDSGKVVLYGQKIPFEQVQHMLAEAGFEVVL